MTEIVFCIELSIYFLFPIDCFYFVFVTLLVCEFDGGSLLDPTIAKVAQTPLGRRLTGDKH